MLHATKIATTKQPLFTPQEKGVPLLPGNNFHDDPLVRRSHKKSHLTDIRQGVPVVAAFLPPAFQPPTYVKREEEVDDDRLPTPPWLAEHNVLRFNAYFLEAVPNSAIETFRVRRCVLYYHTEDRTILVREVAQTNSGMEQGVLIKRHRIPLDPTEQPEEGDTQYVGLHHLNVGLDVMLYGKRFHICDVDSNTRNHLEAVEGVAVPPNEGWLPEDQFEAYLAKRGRLPGPISPGTAELKRAHEYGATGRINKLPSHKIDEARKFFQHSGQTLTFLAAWDDRESLYGELRRLQLRYYLEDDTIQVLEPPVTNSGREDCKQVLLRQRVPKGPPGAPLAGTFTNTSLHDHLRGDAAQHLTYGVSMAGGFLTADDLALGKVVEVHGKQLVLYDCDERTRQWYRAQRRVDLGPPLDVADYFNVVPPQPPKERPPPHDGLGSEEDSLGNWKALVVKPPKRDIHKMAAHAGKLLHFVLRMVPSPNAVIEEEARHFVLKFWMEDDTLQIDEMSVRNSGLLGGKYLARQPVKCTLPNGTTRWYTAEDFRPGRVVTIFSKQFEVLQMDAKTEQILAGVIDPTTPEEVKGLVVALREKLMARFPRTQEAFNAVRGHVNNRVDVEDLLRLYALLTLKCQREDAKTILNMFDADGDGLLDFNEFVALAQGDEHSTRLDELANSIKAIYLHPSATFQPRDAHAEDAIQVAARRSAALKRAQGLLQRFKDKVHQRRVGTVEVYRLMNGASLTADLRPADFRRSLKEVFHMMLPEGDIQVLEVVFFPEGRPCSLQRFSEILERGEAECLPTLTP